MAKIGLIGQYRYETQIRKRNLEVKQQVQAAENAKELEMLNFVETMLERIETEGEEKQNG